MNNEHEFVEMKICSNAIQIHENMLNQSHIKFILNLCSHILI